MVGLYHCLSPELKPFPFVDERPNYPLALVALVLEYTGVPFGFLRVESSALLLLVIWLLTVPRLALDWVSVWDHLDDLDSWLPRGCLELAHSPLLIILNSWLFAAYYVSIDHLKTLVS